MTAWLDRTHIGDCRALLASMYNDGVLVQCCVTSPPYFGLRDYGVPAQIGLEETPAAYVDALVGVFRSVRDILTDNGVLWLNLGDSYSRGGRVMWDGDSRRGTNMHARRTAAGAYPQLGVQAGSSDGEVRRADRPNLRSQVEGLGSKQLLGIPWRVAFALQDDGWYLRSDVIWHKPNAMPESMTDRPTTAHEHVFLLAKSEHYHYDAEAIAEEASGRTSGNRSYKYAGLPGHETKQGFLGAADKEWGTKNCRSVWSIPTQPYAGAHFSVFPEKLVQRCTLAGSRPGDCVLDPFMGSGTTAKVATSLGRHFIGCELNAEYAALQEDRRTTVGMPL